MTNTPIVFCGHGGQFRSMLGKRVGSAHLVNVFHGALRVENVIGARVHRHHTGFDIEVTGKLFEGDLSVGAHDLRRRTSGSVF